MNDPLPLAEETSPSLSGMPDDLLDKCFSFVGEGHYRFVGGTCKRFGNVYIYGKDRVEEEEEDRAEVVEIKREKDTYWRHVSERVPCAKVCLEDQEWLGRTPQQKKRVMKKIVSKAIELGKVEILAWAHKNGFICSKEHFQSVGRNGHFNVLEWARAIELDWYSHWLIMNEEAFHEIFFLNLAVQSGHIHVLEWFNRQGLLPDHDDVGHLIMGSAAEYGHVRVLDWLFEHGYRPSWEVVLEAARGGHIDVLEWAQGHGIHGYESACAEAASHGHLDALQWLRQNGCPWDGRAIARAAENNHNHIVEWARENHCPEPEVEE